MTLKYQTDTLEGLPEAVHDFYEQGDNGYTLKVEGVVPQSKYAEANQRAIDAATEAKRRRGTVERVMGELGIDDAAGLDDAIKALKAKGGKASEDQQAVLEQVRSQYEAKLTEANQRYTSAMMDRAKSELKSAIMAARFHPEVVDDITASAMSRVKLDESGELRIVGKDGNVWASPKGEGYATIADLADDLAAAKPSFLVDAGKGGGGKPPASGQGTTGASSWGEAKTAKDKAAILKSKLSR